MPCAGRIACYLEPLVLGVDFVDADDPQSAGREHRAERSGKDRVVIVDREPRRAEPVARFHGEVPGLLHRPPGRVLPRHPDDQRLDRGPGGRSSWSPVFGRCRSASRGMTGSDGRSAARVPGQLTSLVPH